MKLLLVTLALFFIGSAFAENLLRQTKDGVKLHLAPSTDPRDAVTREEFDSANNKVDCLVGAPSVGEGVFISVSNRLIGASSITADIAVTGSCPNGFVLNVPKTTGVQCTFAAGWVNGPTCDPITCANVFEDQFTSPNCTSGSSAFGVICALECLEVDTVSQGTPTATCGAVGWDSDFQCALDKVIHTCGVGVNNGLGMPNNVDNKLDGAFHDLTSSWGHEIELISVTYRSVCATARNSTIMCIGESLQGQVVEYTGGAMATIQTYTGFIGQTIVQHEHGMYHQGIRLETGEVYTWGYSYHQQTLQPTNTNFDTPTLVPVGGKFAAHLYCGDYNSIITFDDQSMYGGGYAEGGAFFGASSNRKSPGLISTVLPGTSIRRYYAAHSGAIVVNELGEYFARSGSAVRKSQFCLSTEVTYSMPWVKANDGVGLQGDVDSVYCAYSVCALQSKSTGEIYICSDEVVTVDGVGTTALSPRLISSALNSGCSAGTSRNKVAKSYYALAFYGTCPGVMGIASNGAGSVCSSTEPTFQLSSVASLPGVYEAVDGNGHLLAALKKF